MESEVLQESCVVPVDNEETSSTTSSANSAAMTAIEELQQLYTTDPNTERVSLRGRHLSQEDAEAAFTFLQKHFPRLRHLDLRDNDVHELPQDFGTRLPKLVALNISNNNFRFRMGALRTLGETLQHCPCLKSLSLSLSSPAEEQVLLSMLPRLRIFNGTPLPSTRSGSEDNPTSPTMQELQQFCASPLAKATLDKSTASTRRKMILHITRTTTNAEAVVDDSNWGSGPRRNVKNSVRPTELPTSISDDRTDWCKLLKVSGSQMPSSFKGTTEPPQNSHSGGSSSMIVSTDTFLHQLKSVVKAFHECDSLGKTTNSAKLKLFAQLDRHVELLAQQLKRQEPANGKTELSEAMLQTRWSLLEVCAMFGSQKVAQANAGLGNGFGKLLAMQKQLLAAMQAQQRTVQIQAQASMPEAPAQNQHQLKLLLDVAEGLESDLEAVQLQLQQETARRELVEQENLELKRVRSTGKESMKPPNVIRSASTTDNLSTANQAARRIWRSKSEHAVSVKTASEPREDFRVPEMPVFPSTQPPAPQVTDSVRNLSLKQLVDVISCVYSSKAKYDTRATNSGAPRETMEQHMYTYLNTRFGLPKLIVDYASAVWKAAEHFARHENDVAVFVALLRNRLDEGFLEIKRKLQSALVELLRAFFSARYPMKQGKAIASLVQNRLDGLIHEEEWRNILTYLYEPQDSAKLMRLVQQKAEKYQTAQTQAKKPQLNQKPSLSLPFADFEQVLYGYQLQGRLDLLEGFRRVFEELDTERVGVINRPRFVTLAQRVAPTKSEGTVLTLLENLDPFNHDVITFSDAANAFLPDIRRSCTKAHSNSSTKSKINKAH
ncbi:hypothetical protein PHMEG_0003527 [Phytophthora megakarya]|uniref:EF-hand domain-containing protein n=1 Tax=Phytophthora megakarya TaxID=4795 RepID=A0A225WW68_9STRA|nr:hypothetical protein PHMEG_0003527 [Phytophthora megakarya]